MTGDILFLPLPIKKNEHKIECQIHVSCKGLIFLSELIKAVAFSVICEQEIIKLALTSKDRQVFATNIIVIIIVVVIFVEVEGLDTWLG